MKTNRNIGRGKNGSAGKLRFLFYKTGAVARFEIVGSHSLNCPITRQIQVSHFTFMNCDWSIRNRKIELISKKIFLENNSIFTFFEKKFL